MTDDGIETERGHIGTRRRDVVRARDLQRALHVATDVGMWLRRKLADLVEGEDFAWVPARKGSEGRIDAFLTPEAALRVANSGRRTPPGVLLAALERAIAETKTSDAPDVALTVAHPRGWTSRPCANRSSTG